MREQLDLSLNGLNYTVDAEVTYSRHGIEAVEDLIIHQINDDCSVTELSLLPEEEEVFFHLYTDKLLDLQEAECKRQ